ncbi:MAG: MlaD family protein [Pseudomonadales bacterium]
MTNEPELRRATTLSPVWFIPLLAFVIALWLALRAWQESGPVIQIQFQDAAGIAVGKTQVRYRDVVVGEVKDIRLSDDFTRVQVEVEMDRQAEGLLTPQTNFWVVSPRISLSGISGIETLLSGVYIEMDSPGNEDAELQTEFIGLDEPPSVRSYDSGSTYLLVSDSLGSLDIGSPIYHRQVPVGEVTGYKLLPNQDKVQIRFFVKAPYNELVKESSQFWNVGGFDATIGLQGIDLDVGSLNALIAGGVEFETPPMLGNHIVAAPQDHTFYLFEDRDAVNEGAITVSYSFLLRFQGSVRGLKVGAPVEYLGIQVGKVEHISLENDAEQGRHINVLIGIQPERMSRGEELSKALVHREIAGLVSKGMQARLHSGSLIGGSLFVDLVPNAGPEGVMTQNGHFPEIPTSDNEYNQIARQLAGIVERLHRVPIEDIGKDLQESIKLFKQVVADLEHGQIGNKTAALVDNLHKATQGLEGSMKQLETTLRAIDQTVAPDSALNHTLVETLEDISGAAKSMEQLTDELYRYPNAFLLGKEADSP